MIAGPRINPFRTGWAIALPARTRVAHWYRRRNHTYAAPACGGALVMVEALYAVGSWRLCLHCSSRNPPPSAAEMVPAMIEGRLT